MSTLRVNTLQDATGSNQPAMVGAAKAWVNFDGTGTVAIRESFNVSSITDNGTGSYTVNFTTAMPDANYACVTSVQQPGGAASWVMLNDDGAFNTTAPTTSSIRLGVIFYNYTYQDNEYVELAVFR